MIDEDDLAKAELAGKQPAQQFRYIERLALKRLGERYPDDTPLFDDFDYMSAVLPAAQVFGISELANEWSLPSRNGDWQDICRNFRAQATMVSQRIMFEHASESKTDPYSVALDAIAKEKVRFHLNQLRDIIDSEPLPSWRKQDIFDAIFELEQEIEKARTPLSAIVGVATKLWDGDIKVREAVRRVLVVFEDAKADENETARLAATWQKALGRSPSKQLPAPETDSFGAGGSSSKDPAFDDEIPF